MTVPTAMQAHPLLIHLRQQGLPTAPPALREGHDEGTLELSRGLRHITHLDVDALDRRIRALLHDHPVPARHIHYEMDFSEAVPADVDSEAHLDVQEMWDNVRPTFQISLRDTPGPEELEAVAWLCGRFLDAVQATGVRLR